ncbi:MAG: hypothetical protein EHM91_01435 [Planctomycetota bacterium]|nr:MAG: hypothetical protein EHM91_01435 [Planctomycetota bacterium]
MGSALEESLSRFPRFVAKRNFDGLESTYANQAREWAGRSLARKIGEVDLETYQASLALGLAEAERSADEHRAKAIYFEYDASSGWDGRFFVCGSYAPPSAKDESWADEWIEELEGPGIPEFGGFLLEYGFERTDQAKGCTLYMIARTVASLGRCADPASPAKAALCIGYRGQNPLLRIREGR